MNRQNSVLRTELLQILDNTSASGTDKVKALVQCLAQLKNRKLIEQTLKKCKLQAGGFLTNEHLELYYNISKGKNELGYISKGWEDPGFRIGNIVFVPKSKIEAEKQKVPTLLKFCATRGIAMSADQNDLGNLEFHLDSVIYSDGFNLKVFSQVLECLGECAKEIREAF